MCSTWDCRSIGKFTGDSFSVKRKTYSKLLRSCFKFTNTVFHLAKATIYQSYNRHITFFRSTPINNFDHPMFANNQYTVISLPIEIKILYYLVNLSISSISNNFNEVKVTSWFLKSMIHSVINTNKQTEDWENKLERLKGFWYTWHLV